MSERLTDKHATHLVFHELEGDAVAGSERRSAEGHEGVALHDSRLGLRFRFQTACADGLAPAPAPAPFTVVAELATDLALLLLLYEQT